MAIMERMLFTTSWDDGYALDLRVAALLEKYGFTGTFYLCPVEQHGMTMLTDDEKRNLGTRHELGAHTMSHPKLTRVSADAVRQELNEGKKWVESFSKGPCTMFCYPYGDVNQSVRGIAAEAGYRGARTTETLRFASSDPFLMPVSLQIYPFPWRKKGDFLQRVTDPLRPLLNHLPQLRSMDIPMTAYRGWLPMAKAVFMHALKAHQPFFHLFGHSAELERYGLWGDLEKFLAFVAWQTDRIESAPNSALIP